MATIRDELFNNFNEFINNQCIEPVEVCIFIHSLLVEHHYPYYSTGCDGNEYILKDNEGVLKI